MKKLYFSSMIIVAAAALYWYGLPNQPTADYDYNATVLHYMEANNGKVPKVQRRPSDWFYIQRAWPNENVPVEARLEAAEYARDKFKTAARAKLTDEVWEEAGPSNIPGRITDIVVHPDYPDIIYAGSAAGGVFKSTDHGTTWNAIFDDTGIQSVGALAIHPDDPDILYVGTGEANSATDNYEGTGVWKTIDAGVTWTNVGLPNSYHIGRVFIDPLRPESVYVAAAGRTFGKNPDRGLYRTQNGGTDWEQLLYISDSTACIDFAMHPSTGYMLTAMWERIRTPEYRLVGGLTSGIYASSDFGANWTESTPGGLSSSPTLGRIGLAMDPLSYNAYALICNHPGSYIGVYKSSFLGQPATWTLQDDTELDGALGGFGWYFGQIRVAPGNHNTVYVLGVPLHKSTDGGLNWSGPIYDVHVDHHAMYIHPTNHDLVYNGSDGGVNFSGNGGSSWVTYHGMPNTQFYAITIDPHDPARLYGGTQDNGTLRTYDGSTNNWQHINGGDGFYVLVDHTDPMIVYAEYQNGVIRKSINGGSGFSTITNGMDYSNERHNWNTPFAMDPLDHDVLYYGSNFLYKTIDAGDFWFKVSDDLTDGPHDGNLGLGTISTIDVSALNTQVIYVGTDDSRVWVTTDGGSNWTSVDATLPERWVTRVAPDPHDVATAYVTFSGYKEAEHLPHIFRTTDYGQNWTDISGDLPDAPINDVIVDPVDANALYVATDFGVFYTTDLGATWLPFGTGMPIAAIHDLAFNAPTRILVAGTHGRSMYKTTIPCPDENDFDGDGIGDLCDPDDDDDGVDDVNDNCQFAQNPGQEDLDQDGIGDACDPLNCDCTYFCDLNDDTKINPTDVVIIVNFVYKSDDGRTQIVACDGSDNGDWNCDGNPNPTDVVLYVNWVYKDTGNPPCDPCFDL